MKKKNYPLYETTVFEDFRVMTENVAKKHPNKTAISYKKTPSSKETIKITYSEAKDHIRNIGTGMIDIGGRDKHIALIGESSYKWICSYFALISIGAVVVPVDKDLPADEIEDILSFGECEMVFFSSSVKNKLEYIKDNLPSLKTYICMDNSQSSFDIPLDKITLRGESLFKKGDNSYYDYEIDNERLATIVFTSGTTGQRKGVMLSQKNIVSDMTNGMYYFTITPKTMNVLPPHHTFGSTVNFVGHFAQGSEIYISSGLRYLSNELKEQQPSHLVLVPLFIEKLYDRVWKGANDSGKAKSLKAMIIISNILMKFAIDLRKKFFKDILGSFGGKLELIICGGAPLNQKIIDFFDAIGITILNGYGITECSPLISCNRNKYRKAGSVGFPIMHQKVKIKDPDSNGEGEICVKGPNVMLGYFKDPEGTKQAFDEDGYFKTGDYGRLDDENWIYITGRIKNIIILSNGKNIYPEEIENKISMIPGVDEVIVYSGKSTSNRETIVAEIYPDTSFLKLEGIKDPQQYFETEVKKINASMVSYKTVNLVKIRKEEFVKNTSKKILRFKIDKTVE